MNTTILIYSLLPVFLIGLYIYKKDKNKEPKKLIIKLLLGGFYSVILTVLVSSILGLFFDIFNEEYINLSSLQLISYSFLCVALIEEGSKYIMLYKIGYQTKEYDEPYDILLYGSFIGLGFAGIENILYVYAFNLSVAITRAFTAVPMHAFLGVIMGYYLEKYKELNNSKYKLLSILIPIIIHGIYDYCLMNGKNQIVSIIVLILTTIYTIKLLNKISKQSIKNNTYIEKYCPNCGTKYDLNYCINCGNKRK